MERSRKIAFLLIGFGLVIGSVAAGPITTGDTYRITTAGVAVICPLTVGGSFEAQTSAVAGDLVLADTSGAVKGAVQVDLATLQTGIGLRDRHMKDKYLEIGRSDTFTTARLEEIRREMAVGLEQADRGETRPFDPDDLKRRVRDRLSKEHHTERKPA